VSRPLDSWQHDSTERKKGASHQIWAEWVVALGLSCLDLVAGTFFGQQVDAACHHGAAARDDSVTSLTQLHDTAAFAGLKGREFRLLRLASQYGPSAEWADPVAGSSLMPAVGAKNLETKSKSVFSLLLVAMARKRCQPPNLGNLLDLVSRTASLTDRLAAVRVVGALDQGSTVRRPDSPTHHRRTVAHVMPMFANSSVPVRFEAR